MSGRIRNDVSASFLTPRFVVPALAVILILAVVLWFFKGRP